MLKVFCEEYEELKPIALLIGNQNYKEKNSGGGFLKGRFPKVHGWFSNLFTGNKNKLSGK
jgi:hypothetical protein